MGSSGAHWHVACAIAVFCQSGAAVRGHGRGIPCGLPPAAHEDAFHVCVQQELCRSKGLAWPAVDMRFRRTWALHLSPSACYISLLWCAVVPLICGVLQILAAASSVVSGVDMGYAGSNGLEPQQFVSNNQPCGYICYGFGEFDGQGSGHDFSGNVSPAFLLCSKIR